MARGYVDRAALRRWERHPDLLSIMKKAAFKTEQPYWHVMAVTDDHAASVIDHVLGDFRLLDEMVEATAQALRLNQ